MEHHTIYLRMPTLMEMTVVRNFTKRHTMKTKEVQKLFKNFEEAVSMMRRPNVGVRETYNNYWGIAYGKILLK